MAFEDTSDLVERARDSDRDVWEALYRRVYPRLLAYTMRRLDADAARDAVGETMARAVANIGRYRPVPGTGGFDGWLFGICRHVVLDAQRASGRHGYGPPPETVSHADPVERLVSAEEAAAVREAFARLSDADRELLELRVVAGLSAEDAAAVLGRRPGAVRMAQSRALSRLRRHLGEVEGVERVTTRDDELLDVLAASLGPPPDAEPGWAEISNLYRIIDTAADGRPPRGGAPRWRLRPITAAAAGLVLLGGASAAAAVSGAVLPRPVRVAARVVGLPVDSPQLADARAALDHLRDALADKPRDLNDIRADAQEVRDRLGRLSADDRLQVEDEAAFLLDEADAALAPPPSQLGSPPASAPADPPAGASAPTPAANPAPSGDDHGGSPGPSNGAENSGDQHGGDDHGGISATPSGSGGSGPGPSGSSGGDNQTASTIRTDNSGHGSSDGGGSSHDGGGSSDGSSNGGGDSAPR